MILPFWVFACLLSSDSAWKISEPFKKITFVASIRMRLIKAQIKRIVACVTALPFLYRCDGAAIPLQV
jgi:hypothetical protein